MLSKRKETLCTEHVLGHQGATRVASTCAFRVRTVACRTLPYCCRYGMLRGKRPAYVSILVDGSVQVATHGIEMGQGLYTKVAQVG